MSAPAAIVRKAGEFARSFYEAAMLSQPAKRIAVLACVDTRLDIHKILGFRSEDAYIIRNGGGLVTEDVVECLGSLQRANGAQVIILVQHTDCGLFTFTEDYVKRHILNESGSRLMAPEEVLLSLEQDVRQSMARIKASPLIIKKDNIRGFIYDIKSGRLSKVSESAQTEI